MTAHNITSVAVARACDGQHNSMSDSSSCNTSTVDDCQLVQLCKASQIACSQYSCRHRFAPGTVTIALAVVHGCKGQQTSINSTICCLLPNAVYMAFSGYHHSCRVVQKRSGASARIRCRSVHLIRADTVCTTITDVQFAVSPARLRSVGEHALLPRTM
jgi:hypothetical protein